MNDILSKINDQILIFQDDSKRHIEKGNKSAGRRARRASSELTKLFKKYRITSIEMDA